MKISESDLQKLITAMENKKLSVSQVVELIANSNVQKQNIINTDGEIKLIVDYTKTIDQMIADGNYDWKDKNITAKNFPVSQEMIGKKVEVSAKLFYFNCDLFSEKAIPEIGKAGYRPATLMELLVLGSSFPWLQRQFPIIAPGSIWHDACFDRYMPYLGVDDCGRRLSLRWFDDGCRARCRFLGIRK